MRTLNTIEVPSFEQFTRKIIQHGGKVSEKITISGAGDFAYCEDTEGNVFGIIEKSKAAEQVQLSSDAYPTYMAN